MKLTDNEHLVKLNSIAKEELSKIEKQFTFGRYGNTQSMNDDGKNVVIHGYSILNTSLFGITYWHSELETGYSINEVGYEIKVGKNEFARFTSLEDAEKYLKTTKRRFITTPYAHDITKHYRGHYSVFQGLNNVNDVSNFSQLKHLTEEIRLKKTYFEKKFVE